MPERKRYVSFNFKGLSQQIPNTYPWSSAHESQERETIAFRSQQSIKNYFIFCTLYISIYLYIFLSIYQSIYQSIYMYIYMYTYIRTCMYLYIFLFTVAYIYHDHHDVLLARISKTLSCHSFLSSIAPDRSSWLHIISVQRCCW